MKKVLIIGNSGSGKTTFAKALAPKTNLPLVHLDKLYWCGEWEHVTRDAFDALLQDVLNSDEWIIDGNFDRTMPKRLEYADTVFWFDLPTITCLWGATTRIFSSYGKSRADMGGNCPERFDRNKLALYKAIIKFNKNNRKRYKHLLEEQQGKEIIIFKSRKQAVCYLKNIQE